MTIGIVRMCLLVQLTRVRSNSVLPLSLVIIVLLLGCRPLEINNRYFKGLGYRVFKLVLLLRELALLAIQ